MKNVLIFNPYAGKGSVINNVEKIQTMLRKAGIDTEIRMTAAAMQAEKMAETAAAEGAERVIICGGDGSINEAVNGLVEAQKKGFTGTALGIIPNGRGNDFCACINMPLQLDQMGEIFTRDHRLSCDVGSAGDGTFERYFINGSGFGIESAINYYAARSPLKGKISYIYGIGKSIFNDLYVQDALITLDGKENHYPFALFAAMNGRQEGGGFRLAPNFRLNDGLLDICMVGGNIPPVLLLRTIPHLSSGKLDYPGIFSAQAASVHVHLEPDKRGLFSQTDGETIFRNGHDFYARISPYKLDIICPE